MVNPESTPLAGQITDDLDALIEKLPARLANRLWQAPNLADLLEVVMDLGRLPEARFMGSELLLSDETISEEDLEFVVSRIGVFGDDNRAGIERTLHRISCIRNRLGRIVGLTCRVGRAVYGTTAIVRDVIEAGHSILLVGGPGVGKTTMLREMARVLADDLNKRVVIVDTSNEIGGDGDIPHPAIGRARRMQVRTPANQHAVMIEAVENHMPEVIIIDEIGTELEAAAARTIAERGVQLIGTAHGNSLDNLMLNPTLSDLVGGIQAVTLGDDEARRRGTQKTVLERKAPPSFDVVVEIIDWQHVTVHPDVAATIDAILLGQQFQAEVRERSDSGEVSVLNRTGRPALPQREQPRQGGSWNGSARPAFNGDVVADLRPRLSQPPATGPGGKTLKIHPYGLATNRLERAIRSLNVAATIVRDVHGADAVMTLKSYFRRKPQPLRDAEEAGVPIHVLKSNTEVQMSAALALIFNLGLDPTTAAIQEAEDAIQQVMSTAVPVELQPQNSYVRRMQHAVAERYNLASKSRGAEPNRRVRIYRPGSGAAQDWAGD